MNKTAKIDIENIYINSIENGIFQRNSFNSKIQTVWTSHEKSLSQDQFIELVTEVLGPCVHFVDFNYIWKDAA